MAHQDLYRQLLEGINRQLDGHGMIVRPGVAVDASLVASSRRQRKVIEVSSAEVEEASIPEGSGAKVSYSEDVEASCTVKGKRPHYGYKVRTGTDAYEGFVLGDM